MAILGLCLNDGMMFVGCIYDVNSFGWIWIWIIFEISKI